MDKISEIERNKSLILLLQKLLKSGDHESIRWVRDIISTSEPSMHKSFEIIAGRINEIDSYCKLYNEDYVQELKSKYSFNLIDNTWMDYKGVKFFVFEYKEHLENFLKRHMGYEIYIYEPALPTIRAIIINPKCIKDDK